MAETYDPPDNPGPEIPDTSDNLESPEILESPGNPGYFGLKRKNG